LNDGNPLPRPPAGTDSGAAQDSTRALLALAWPILVAQVAVIGLGVIDTVMAGRLSATDLAGVALGSSIYATVFVGFMATLQALTPIAGHHFGAGRLHEIGVEVEQTLWLALFLTLIALPLLLINRPWLNLIGAEPAVADISSIYLWAVAGGLPAALASRAYIALNAAVSRPTVTMLVNLAALAAKVPLNLVFIHGVGPLPAMGGAGCGIATALLMWLMLIANWSLWRFDPFYRRFRASARARRGPQWRRQRELLRLGLPSGGTTLIEVSSFTFITLLLARFGATTVAGHQIVANVVALLFMLPLSYGIASGVLVAQALGAGRPDAARRAALRGYRLAVGTALLVVIAVYLLREPLIGQFTRDPPVTAVALGLLGLGLAFHLFDAVQGIAAFVLRGYKVAFLPMIIHGVTLWAIGLFGGYWLANHPPAAWTLGAAASFWLAGAFGLAIAAAALTWLAAFVARSRVQEGDKAKSRAQGPAL
jgi:multidrug resistance protein, MATE family